MINQFSRTELLLGSENMQKLKNARVAVFGIGGVGGNAVEALVRSGVGAVDIIDNDRISLSNINRQVFATHKTVGKFKTDAAKERLLEINPDVKVNAFKLFYSLETAGNFDFSRYSYIVDAIDSVKSKIQLAVQARQSGTPIISSMGAGNKLDPTAFEVKDIYKTSVCPLARIMRRELKKLGIDSLKVVYSKEAPLKPQYNGEELKGSRPAPGSTAFVPAVAGLTIAGEVVRDLTGL